MNPTTAKSFVASDDKGIKEALEMVQARGFGVVTKFLDASLCERIISMYGNPELYRKRIEMAQHGFGAGEYQYFGYPLPPEIQQLRAFMYAQLQPIANLWSRQLKEPEVFPGDLNDYLRHCQASGQDKATPLMLKYGKGDYNCLHQDIYGACAFPLQVAVLLSTPEQDFHGGEFLFLEQRPRRQSRAEVVHLGRGDAVIFSTRGRPEMGKRGHYAVQHRHGVSTLSQGQRFVLGLIFHDAT